MIEEICMVDNLSNGRFQIGIGRGTGGGQEFAMWGGNPEENDRRFEETFQILMKGLTNDFLSFEGQHFTLRDLWMELKPKQKPHPPFWYAGNPVHAENLAVILSALVQSQICQKLLLVTWKVGTNRMQKKIQPSPRGKNHCTGPGQWYTWPILIKKQ
ncbi:MAG: hypothetical protein Ct9H300mP27_08180 [Chloroflexota bacterium]|nr:MAG: hypothetical protein Ct9H300mP27_08180 [Chloroflexota bacterium]